MVPASVALWNWGDAPRDASGQRTDLYCWRYNTFGFSCWMDSLNGDWSSGVEAAEADPGAYLLGLRALRSVSYRLILLSLRWSTPVLLCFCDTVQIYNFVAAIFSAARALHLRIYYATTWAATLSHLATTAYLFNLNLLGLPMDEHYAVAPLKEDEGTRGLDGGAAREPRRREWLRFSQAWNAIVLTLRRSDLLSDKERDMLLFHTLSGAEARDFLQVTGCHCHYSCHLLLHRRLHLTTSTIPSAARAGRDVHALPRDAHLSVLLGGGVPAGRRLVPVDGPRAAAGT